MTDHTMSIREEKLQAVLRPIVVDWFDMGYENGKLDTDVLTERLRAALAAPLPDDERPRDADLRAALIAALQAEVEPAKSRILGPTTIQTLVAAGDYEAAADRIVADLTTAMRRPLITGPRMGGFRPDDDFRAAPPPDDERARLREALNDAIHALEGGDLTGGLLAVRVAREAAALSPQGGSERSGESE
jgi:hypothetical protein